MGSERTEYQLYKSNECVLLPLWRNIKFVLQEELDVSGSPDALCDERFLRACFIANYIDSTFVCCPDTP